MQVHTLPAARGWAWIVEGLRLWQRSPLIISVSAMSFILLVLVIGSIPRIGPLLSTLILPPLSVGMYLICRSVDINGSAKPTLLFAGFRQRLSPLLVLGAIHFVLTLIILAVSSLFDDGALLGVVTGNRSLDATLPAASQYAALFVSVVATPLTMAYWFAPQLVGLCNLPPLKALLFSLIASWRNIRALLVFFLGLMLAFMMFATLGDLLGVVVPRLLVLMLFLTVLVPVFQTACYANIKDVFGDLVGDQSAA